MRGKRGYAGYAGFLLVLCAVGLLIPLFPGDPARIDVTGSMLPPCLAHPLGTDELGRDCLLRVIYGSRVSLAVGALTMLVVTLAGSLAGILAGYLGGAIDELLMRTVDVLSSIPWILLVIVIQMFVKRGIASMVLVMGLFGWTPLARIVRNQTRTIRSLPYVEYARLLEKPLPWILTRHILLPNLPVILTYMTAAAANAILTESTLSFLNLGVPAPLSSWGSLLQNAQKYFQQAPLQALVPGTMIVLTVFSLNRVSNGVRVRFERGHRDA